MKQKSRKDRQSGSAQLTARRLFEGGLVLLAAAMRSGNTGE